MVIVATLNAVQRLGWPMNEKEQSIVTELRNLGDGRTIVLYTNDDLVYKKLLDLANPIKIVPYEQERGGKATVLGADLYFPKEYRSWLEKNIGIRALKRK
jgi:hypothetical protein